MEREKELQNWLQKRYPQRSFTLSFAAADADFRRYFRAVFENGESVVCMDAPPDKMSIEPYLRVREIFAAVCRKCFTTISNTVSPPWKTSAKCPT